MRIVHEAQLHDRNCFLTLTYDEDHLPKDGSLNKLHFQKFIRKWRKRLPGGQTLRYFHCGEYGDENKRPHYHAIIFGHDFSEDREFFKNSGESKLYVSPSLMELWHYGWHTIGDVTWQSASYVARYVMKKRSSPSSADPAILERQQGEYDDAYLRVNGKTGEMWHVEPEYVTMSRKP